jgi:hypothetical protein
MRLLGVELTRMRWRRAVTVLLAASVLLPALVWAGLVWDTRPVSAEEVRQAKEIVADNQRRSQGDVDDCVAHPGDWGVPTDETDLEPACRDALGVGTEQYEWYLPRQPLDVADQREGAGLGVITILAALLMLVGTTFAGHDWNTGSLGNQLLFEPRRLRLWAAKAAAVAAVSLAVSLAVLAAWWGALWLVAGQRDLPASGHTWALVRGSALRGSAVVTLAAVAGYALTMLFRSTVATLGAMFAVAVVGQAAAVALFGEGVVRWLIPTNAAAVIFDGFDYYAGGEQVCVSTGDGSTMDCTGMEHLSAAAGTAYLLVLLGLAVALSLWSFRRRDVP